MSGDVVTSTAYSDASAARTPPLDVSEHEKKSYPTSSAAKSDKMCFNVWDTNRLNCFSAVYHRNAIHKLVAKLKEHLQTGGSAGADSIVAAASDGGGAGGGGTQESLGTVISACKVASMLAEAGHITRAALSDLASCTASAQFMQLKPLYQDPDTPAKDSAGVEHAPAGVRHATQTCIAS